MKIADLKLHVLKSPLAEPFAFSQGWVGQRSATLVEVITDEGISGWDAHWKNMACSGTKSRSCRKTGPATPRCATS